MVDDALPVDAVPADEKPRIEPAEIPDYADPKFPVVDLSLGDLLGAIKTVQSDRLDKLAGIEAANTQLEEAKAATTRNEMSKTRLQNELIKRMAEYLDQ